MSAEWQPIETVPQGPENVVLIKQVYMDDRGKPQMAGPYRAYYSNGWWRFESNGINISISPTHWKALSKEKA